MASFTNIALALFCLFTLSLARTQPNSNDVVSKVNDETESKSSMQFNPINRRFSVRSKHPCRHRQQLKPDQTISYGNDMLVADGDFEKWENNDMGRVALKRQRFGDWKGMDRPFTLRNFHHHHHRREREKRGGFMKRVHEFVNNYVL